MRPIKLSRQAGLEIIMSELRRGRITGVDFVTVDGKRIRTIAIKLGVKKGPRGKKNGRKAKRRYNKAIGSMTSFEMINNLTNAKRIAAKVEALESDVVSLEAEVNCCDDDDKVKELWAAIDKKNEQIERLELNANYRQVNLRGIVAFRADGKQYVITTPPVPRLKKS